MAQLSTHVLDATTGRPATGVTVTLDGDAASTATDADGRIAGLGGDVPPGVHRLHFDTGAYFATQGVDTFYPEVVITFDITDAAGKYHVPLLLSPYSYSTYRGS